MNSGVAKDIRKKIMEKMFPPDYIKANKKIILKSDLFKKTYADALKQYKAK